MRPLARPQARPQAKPKIIQMKKKLMSSNKPSKITTTRSSMKCAYSSKSKARSTGASGSPSSRNALKMLSKESMRRSISPSG